MCRPLNRKLFAKEARVLYFHLTGPQRDRFARWRVLGGNVSVTDRDCQEKSFDSTPWALAAWTNLGTSQAKPPGALFSDGFWVFKLGLAVGALALLCRKWDRLIGT